MVADDPESFADLDGHTGSPNQTGEVFHGNFLDPYMMTNMPQNLTPSEMEALAAEQAAAQQTPQTPAQAAALQAQNQAQQNQQPTTSRSTNAVDTNQVINRLKADPTGNGSGLCSSSTCMSVLKKASDFSAGAGDFLSFGLTEKARQHLGSDNVVDKQSGAYTAGLVTGIGITAAGGALSIGKVTAGLETKIAIHGAQHAFPLIGEVPHLQIMWWIAGVGGQMMGSPIRIPLAPWWP